MDFFESLKKLSGLGTPKGEQYLGLLPALLGAYSYQRGGRLGAPLMVLGDFLSQNADQRQQTQEQNQDASAIQSQLEAINQKTNPIAYQAWQQLKKSWPQLTASTRLDEAKNLLKLESDESMKSEEKPTPFSVWLKQNPNAPVAQFYQAAQTGKPQKHDLYNDTVNQYLQQHPNDLAGAVNAGMAKEIELRKASQKPDRPERDRYITYPTDKGTVLLDLDSGRSGVLPGSVSKNAPKPLNPAQRVTLIKNAQAIAEKRLTTMFSFLPGFRPTGDQIKAETNKVLQEQGLNPDATPLTVNIP